MKLIEKLNLMLAMILLIGVSACNASVTTPTVTLTPVLPASTQPAITLRSASTPILVIPTQLPTQTIIPVAITPDSIQVEKWKEYEEALAKALFPSSFIPGEFLCDWEILGRSDQEVYVWTVCMSIFLVANELPYHSTMPAVIHTKADGAVQRVEIPGGGANYASDIREMFPTYAQDGYFNGPIHFQELTDHLNWRRGHPEEPPLVILSGAPTPEPTPTEWLPFNPNIINNDGCEKLVPTSMPVAGTENLTQEEIAQKLFTLYLEKHLTLPPHHFCQLENYRIEKTTIGHNIDFLAQEQGVHFVNWIVYSVQIREVPSSWVAANGILANDGWILNKVLIVGVTKVSDKYVLKLIGTGP